MKKTYLTLFICIAVFTAAYLYYVNIDRQKSIDKYFSQPRIGDVYKIKADHPESGENLMQYYKVFEIDKDGLAFYPSKMSADASADIFLTQFDKTEIVYFSFSDLKAIKEGKWKNYLHKNTELIEIVRK